MSAGVKNQKKSQKIKNKMTQYKTTSYGVNGGDR